MNGVVIVGSHALVFHSIDERKPLDLDIISNRKNALKFAESLGKVNKLEDKKFGFIIYTDNGIVEVDDIDLHDNTRQIYETMLESSLCGYAHKDWLYFMKMSHRYLKNSPHFLKTMRDIHLLRKSGAKMPNGSEKLFKEREQLTYDYGHPKLSVSKKDFFSDDGISYVYDHDSIHRAVAIESTPAYTKYMVDGQEVLTSKEKFFEVDFKTRILGVYEESAVLALERSQIPFDFKPSPEASFLMALEKVCTSITSGWFREFAWENYPVVRQVYQKLGKDKYLEMFQQNYDMLLPFNKESSNGY